MPQFLETVTLGEVAVLTAVLGLVVAFLRKAIPALRKASRLIDDVVGAPGHPGVMDRLATLERQVDQVADAAGAAAVQLHPNGGSSTRDQIDRLSTGQAEVLRQLQELADRLPPPR